MPVEIRELQIRVQVQGAASPTQGNSSESPRGEEDRRKEWMAECLDQVFEILQSKKER